MRKKQGKYNNPESVKQWEEFAKSVKKLNNETDNSNNSSNDADYDGNMSNSIITQLTNESTFPYFNFTLFGNTNARFRNFYKAFRLKELKYRLEIIRYFMNIKRIHYSKNRIFQK